MLQTCKIQIFIEKKAISQTEAGEEEKKQKAQHAAKIPLCITKSHFRHIRVMWPTISKIFIGYYSDKQIALEMSCLVHSGVFSPSFIPKFLQKCLQQQIRSFQPWKSVLHLVSSLYSWNTVTVSDFQLLLKNILAVRITKKIVTEMNPEHSAVR